MTKSRIFLFLLLAFIIGVAIRSFASIPYFLFWLGLTIAIIGIVWGILQKQENAVVGGFLFLAVLAGVFRFDQYEMSRPDLADFYDKPLVLYGVVVEDPRRGDSSQRLKIKIERVDSAQVNPNFYTLVTTRRYPEYKIGDGLKLEGLLQKPENYNDFDYVSYLAKEDIFSIVSFPLIEKLSEEKGSKLIIFLAKIKRAFEKKIDEILPEPQGSFLKGLLLGERESLPQDLIENFKRTGTTHIVALSGYNITLVARFFLALLLFLTVPFYLSFWFATLAIVLFVIMVGASPSVVRAGIMGVLVLFAGREGRSYHITNAIVFAGALMLWQNPKILRFDTAFQLSFLATLGLIYISPRLEKIFQSPLTDLRSVRDEHGPPQLKKIFIETLSAQIAVLPLLIYLFGRVSLISPLANILILLAVPYSMAVGFFAVLLGFIYGPFGQIVGWLAWALLEYKLRVIELLAKVPLASVGVKNWAMFPLAIFYFWFLRGLKKS